MVYNIKKKNLSSSTNHKKNNNILNNLVDNNIPQEEDSKIIKAAKKEIKKTNISQSINVKAAMCADSKKFLLVDIIVFITIIRYFIKYIIRPFILHKYSPDATKLKNTIIYYLNKYTDRSNLLLFIFYILTILIFISFTNYQLQNIGIVMFISFVTSIAGSADQLLTGALISGIIVYLFIRIRTELASSVTGIQKCDISIFKSMYNLIKDIYIYLKHKLT